MDSFSHAHGHYFCDGQFWPWPGDHSLHGESFGRAQGDCLHDGELWLSLGPMSPQWRVMAMPRVIVLTMESCGHAQGQCLHNGELWPCPGPLSPQWRVVAMPRAIVSTMESCGHAQGHCLHNGVLWPCPRPLSPQWSVVAMPRATRCFWLLGCWRVAVCPAFELLCDLMHLFICWLKEPCSSVVFNQHLMTAWVAPGTTSVKTGWTLVHATFVWKKDHQCEDRLNIGACYICVEEGSVISCGSNSAVTCIAHRLLCVWCACTLIPFWAAIVACASELKADFIKLCGVFLKSYFDISLQYAFAVLGICSSCFPSRQCFDFGTYIFFFPLLVVLGIVCKEKGPHALRRIQSYQRFI